MKKLLCVLLTLLLLTACGAGQGETTVTTEDPNAPRQLQLGSQTLTFDPWMGEGLPASGDYFLTADVVLTEAVTVSGSLNLHLNGFTVTSAEDVLPGNLFVIPKDASLTVVDEEGGTGKILAPRSITAKVRVSNIFLVDGRLTLANATVDGSAINLEDKADGLCIYIRDGGEFTMLSGTIVGGTTWRNVVPEDGTEPLGNGGAIYIAAGGTCNMENGEIHSGSAARGGNIFVAANEEKKGVLNITGGAVRDGEATVGGGNLYIQGEMNMTGASVEDGESFGHGGNLFVEGSIRVGDSTFSGGQSNINSQQYMHGGNVIVNGLYASVYMENTEILGGKTNGAENHGGNICVTGLGAANFELVNCVLENGAGHRGGNFYIGHLSGEIPEENMDYVITGTVFQDGTCSYRGANICVDTKKEDRRIQLTLNDCRLLLPEVSAMDNLSVGAGAKDNTCCDVFMNGGVLQNGNLNIYGNGVVNLKGVDWNGDSHGGGGTLNITE